MQIGEEALEWRDFAAFSGAALYDLLRFRQAIFVVEQASPYADLDGIDHRAHHLVASIEGALAGCLRLSCGERSLTIGRVAVAPQHRRRGLARIMMRAALARCRRDHAGLPVALSAQTYLAPFYASLGFAATGSPYDDCGVPHVAMIRAPERRPDA